MTRHTHSWTAMTAATIPVPASNTRLHRPERHLIGVGIFNARYQQGRWRLSRHALAIPAGRPEGALLHGIASRLPADSVLIGWNVDQVLMPTRLNAAATALPVVAMGFLEPLCRLVRGGVVDLALGHGAASLATIAADQAIYAPAWDAEANIDDWAAGHVDRLRRDLADEALAIWTLFVRCAGLTGIDAEAATDAWVARRRALRLVTRTDSAR